MGGAERLRPSPFGGRRWYRGRTLTPVSVPVASPTDALVASSVAKEFAAKLGFSRTQIAQVGLAAGELASNCWRHGGGGHLELRHREGDLEVRAIDRGPGIPDLEFARQDGVSRGQHAPSASVRRDSLGAGLGSVQRVMDEVEIFTYRRVGTTVIARKYLPKAPA